MLLPVLIRQGEIRRGDGGILRGVRILRRGGKSGQEEDGGQNRAENRKDPPRGLPAAPESGCGR